ncbi:DUF1295 domain-containing protein [Erythrobacter sp. HKB08]|uniref:DUF1295 domain-containing protein n=1 Tax=Erythrobacter sp. HKB08 TaxID=2502843 RepID=UPI0010086A4D|nr:DUF1295 domain-containing protein [Erythrobacter sp. HKB08]
MIDLLLINVAILLGIVLVLWAISVIIDDVSFIDSFWGAGMGILAVASWLHGPGSHEGLLATLIMVMAAAWGFRLGGYLFLRWRKEGEDQRYRRMMRKAREKGRVAFALSALFKIWLGQAFLLFTVSSPAQVGIIAAGERDDLSLLAYAGVALYLVGIFFEWVGDWQLSRFKKDPSNEGEILDTGLWRYTRHPNYFGDACAWWGIWLVTASVGWEWALYTVIGPIFLTFTLTKWSGAALLEAGMKKKRGDKYADYIERTSAFFPWPPKSKG